jgi:hypothetical protein
MHESSGILRLLTWSASVPPERLSKDIVRLAILPEFAQLNGKFMYKGREIKPPAYALNRQVQKQLWDVSLKLAGLTQNKEEA